jgi:glc operon protein GlcG
MAGITLDSAHALIAHVREAAASAGLSVSCSVVDAAGHELMTARMDDAPWFTAGLARVKASTAAAVASNTADLAALRDQYPEVLAQIQEQLPFTLTTLPGGLILGGGAAIGVSGAHPDQDVELALQAISDVL